MGATKSIEDRIGELEAQLGGLRLRLEKVEAGATAVRRPKPWRGEPAAGAAGASDAAADVAGWAGASVLLPRVSSLSFLLVVALVLRTLTDSGVVGPRAGAFAGIGYAALLMVASWVLYARRSILAPVFAVCGAVLLCSIVVETNTHFASLSTAAAFGALAATCLFMTALGERYKTALPGAIGVLGAVISGVAMTVPNPKFVPLGFLLLVSGLLGIAVSRRLRGDWIGWTLFAVSSLVLLIFALRIKVCLTSACYVEPVPGTAWFPYLANGFGLLWVGQSLIGLLRPLKKRASVLALTLPTLGCTVAYVTSLQVAAGNGTIRGLGVTGLFVAAGLVAVAAWAGLRGGGGAAALNAFAVAAVVLFALGFSSATGSFLGALPLLSFTAFGMAILSARWQSGGTRVISYLLQVGVAIALTLQLLAGERNAANPGLAALAAGALALAGLLHHRWCHRNAPPAGSAALELIGAGDRCAVALLTSALAGCFFLVRSGAFLLISSRTADYRNTFGGAQSVILDCAAMALFALAASRRNTELRTVAILVTVAAAAKVVVYDLVVLQGIARVVSVFSFGLLAAVASVVLGRWQRRAVP